MEDAEEKATLISRAPGYQAAAAGESLQPYSQTSGSLKRYLKEVREISHETSNAKVVEWISVPCAVVSTLAPVLVAVTEPSRLRQKLFHTLQGLRGVETFAGYGIPPIIVLCNLYANENETVSSAAGAARERRAVRGVIGCQVFLAVCLVASAVVNLRMTYGANEGTTYLPYLHKRAFLIAACELASAFIFVVLGVYKWILAGAIASLSLRADAITCFVAVYSNVITGCANFYDALALSRAGISTTASKERVRYLEFFSLAAAVFLLGAAVYHLRAAVHIPRPV